MNILRNKHALWIESVEGVACISSIYLVILSFFHFVIQEEVDAGAIVAQEAVPVLPKDTVESLQERVKKAEHICYPKALELLASGQIVLGDDGRVEYQW